MASTLQPRSPETLGRLLAVLAVVYASIVAVRLLFVGLFADAFVAGWILGFVVVAFVGGLGAWANRTPLVWVAALLLTGLSIVAMMSIGFFFLPAALLLLGSALILQSVRPPLSERQPFADEPPAVRDIALKALGGVSSATIGGWLVYAGAFTQELFGACASETLDCVVAKAHWAGIGMTVLGLVAVGLGGWVLWKQISVARLLASKQVG